MHTSTAMGYNNIGLIRIRCRHSVDSNAGIRGMGPPPTPEVVRAAMPVRLGCRWVGMPPAPKPWPAPVAWEQTLLARCAYGPRELTRILLP